MTIIEHPRKCTRCGEIKDQHMDFYLCRNIVRSECKKCTIKRNVKYQKDNNSWKTHHGGDENRRAYMRSYYAKNKEKFSKYRKEFKEKYPDYYHNYFIAQKGKK